MFLRPQFLDAGGGRYRAVSPGIYAKMCNAIWSGVHLTGLQQREGRVRRHGPEREQQRPAAAVLALAAPLPPRHEARRAPASTSTRTIRITATGRDAEQPPPLKGTAITLGNIDVLIKELTRLYGPKRVWLTEYGFQTNPPDRLFGVSFAKQARYLTQSFAIARAHKRIDMMLWFLIKDEARGSRNGRVAVGLLHDDRLAGSRAGSPSSECPSKAAAIRAAGRIMERPVATEQAPPARPPSSAPSRRDAGGDAAPLGDIRSTSPYFPIRGAARRAASIAALIVLDLVGLVLGLYGALALRELVYGDGEPLWGFLWNAEDRLAAVPHPDHGARLLAGRPLCRARTTGRVRPDRRPRSLSSR